MIISKCLFIVVFPFIVGPPMCMLGACVFTEALASVGPGGDCAPPRPCSSSPQSLGGGRYLSSNCRFRLRA